MFLLRVICALFLLSPFFSTRPLYAVEFPADDTFVDLPVTVTPNIAANPDLSMDSNGNVYVVWEDNRNGPGNIFFNHRFPEGDWEFQSIALTTGNPRNTDVEQGDAAEPHICSDDNGHIYVVWVDNRAVKEGTGRRDIYFRYSKDFGASWLPEFNDHRIDTDTAVSGTRAGDSIEPQIACDKNGHVYIVWRDDRNLTGFYDVYFRSLFIDFETPGNPINPLQFPDFRINIGEENKAVEGGSFDTLTPQIAENGQGTVYIVWEDTREDAAKEIFPGVHFNSSSNHGVTWRPADKRIDHRPLGGSFLIYRSRAPRIAADNDTGVHVAWLDNGPRPLQGIETAGRYKLFYNRSLDSGNTWFANDALISYAAKTVEVQEASITVNTRRGVFTAWTDDRGDSTPADESGVSRGNPNVFFNHSENAGSAWLDFGNTTKQISDNIRIDVGNTANNASNPQIVTDNARNIFITWEESRQGFQNIYMNLSPDTGRKGTWQESDIRVDGSSSLGNSTRMKMRANESGQVAVVWQDDRKSTGRSNIYYNEILLDILTLSKGPRVGEACFIATAAYGSPWEPHVTLLRQFRDRFLLPHPLGNKFVDIYYRYSPPAADFLNQHPAFKPLVRMILVPFVGLADFCLSTSPLQKLLFLSCIPLLLLGAFLILRRRDTDLFHRARQG
ncbi:MAG: hypothetical protein HZA19_03650 [Nitrospirae bacterium]|nr:hypothetical protein [Nitrospirota bacterium]